MTTRIKYREQVVRNAVEVLASQLKRDDDRRPNDITNQPVNTTTDTDVYAQPAMKDPGYPGWVTGNGRGPSMSKIAYPTRAIRLAPEADPLTSSFGYQAGGWLADQMAYGKPRLRWLGGYLTDIGTRPGRAALKGSIGGGAIGAASGLLSGHSPAVTGGLGALLGGAGSVGAGLFTKASAFDDLRYLLQRLDQDSSIGAETRNILMDALQRLKPQQANALADVVRTFFGAGVGALIANYLLKLGLVGSSVFALLGATAGYGLGRINRNAFGERVRGETDPFGRPL